MPEETSASSSAEGVEEKPCSSTSAAAEGSDVMEEAKKLIGTGNRHVVMGDYVSALGYFQDACSMLAATYGDTAYECGEAFFRCGSCLLELARMENGVLGNALDGVPEGSDDDEAQPSNSNIESADNLDEETRDELRRQVCDAMAEEVRMEAVDSKLVNEKDVEVKRENDVAKSPVKQDADGSEIPGNVEKSSPGVNGEEKSQSTDVNNIGESSAPSSGQETMTRVDSTEEQTGDEESESGQDEEQGNDDDEDDDEEGEKNGEEEEVGNLQLAWEMLEVAKLIYRKQDNQDDQLCAAQVYLKLGEVSAESGNYSQALEDLQECLTIQLKYLPPHSRLLAESHYQIATTLCCVGKYDQAIEHYNSSIKAIETRLAMLQDAIGASDGTAEAKSEVEELKQLLPDISEKVEDAKESQRMATTASQAIQQTLGGASTSSAFQCENGGPSSSTLPTIKQSPDESFDSASSSKAVSDISHLVKKRKKPEEDSPVEETDAKQAKQEATVNGSGDSNASNGNGVQGERTKENVNQAASIDTSA